MGLAALAHCRSHLFFCLFRTGACDGTVSVTLGPSPLVLSDGPGVYALNVECVWLVEAPGPITVVFTRFHTQADYDFLEIFDGTGDDAGLLANASGPALPEPLFANSTSVKIVFTSTGYVTFSGFELELFALAPGGTWVPTGVPTAAPTWASESGAALCFVPCSLPHERMRLPQCGSAVSASCACCSRPRRRGVPMRPSREAVRAGRHVCVAVLLGLRLRRVRDQPERIWPARPLPRARRSALCAADHLHVRWARPCPETLVRCSVRFD
jgi:hypothetical protein